MCRAVDGIGQSDQALSRSWAPIRADGSSEDVCFAGELASRAALAVENARCVSKRANEASRLKDEFLATLSHESDGRRSTPCWVMRG